MAAALRTAAFLSKSEVRGYPLVGRSAWAGGSVFRLPRSRITGSPDERRRALEETIRMCRESTAVVVFPEGTISRDGHLLERVHYSSMRRAYQEGLKVILVGLH